MAFGPEMLALPAESAAPIILKEITPQEAPQLPDIPRYSAIGQQLSLRYLAMLRAMRNPKHPAYRYLATSTDTLAWGIFAREAAEAQGSSLRPIGTIGLLGTTEQSPSAYITINDPAYHRQGIARRVYPVAAYTAQQTGVRQVAAQVRVDNVPSLGLFRAMGFMPLYTQRIPGERQPYHAMLQSLDPVVLADEKQYLQHMTDAATAAHAPRPNADEVYAAHRQTLALLRSATMHAATST